MLNKSRQYHDPVLKTKESRQDYGTGGKVYKGYSSDIIADMTMDWMENRDKSKPFMAMCHFKATHESYDYPERFGLPNKIVPNLLGRPVKTTKNLMKTQSFGIFMI